MNDNYDRKSYSGSALLLGGGAISWLSKKQSPVAMPTSGAKYIVLLDAARETKSLKNLMHETLNTQIPITLCNNNQSAQA